MSDQKLVIQELEARVQQLTQESEELQNSRSKLAKEKVSSKLRTSSSLEFHYSSSYTYIEIGSLHFNQPIERGINFIKD